MTSEVFRNHVAMVVAEARISRNFFTTSVEYLRPVDPELAAKVDQIATAQAELEAYVRTRTER